MVLFYVCANFLMPLQPPKMQLNSKMVESDQKMNILLLLPSLSLITCTFGVFSRISLNTNLQTTLIVDWLTQYSLWHMSTVVSVLLLTLRCVLREASNTFLQVYLFQNQKSPTLWQGNNLITFRCWKKKLLSLRHTIHFCVYFIDWHCVYWSIGMSVTKCKT